MWKFRSMKPIFYEKKKKQSTSLTKSSGVSALCHGCKFDQVFWAKYLCSAPRLETHYYFSSKWISWDESGSSGTWPKRASPKQNHSKECTPHQEELSVISIRFLPFNAFPPYLHSVRSQKVCCGTDPSQFDHSLILGSFGWMTPVGLLSHNLAMKLCHICKHLLASRYKIAM